MLMGVLVILQIKETKKVWLYSLTACEIKMRNGKMWKSSLGAYGGGPTLRETSYAAWHDTRGARSGSVHSLTGWSAKRRLLRLHRHAPRPCCSQCRSRRTPAEEICPTGHLPMDTDISWQHGLQTEVSRSCPLSSALHHHEHQHHSSGRSVVFNFPSQLHRMLPLSVSATLCAFNVKVFKGRCSDVFLCACVDFLPLYPKRSHLLVLSKL